MCNTLQQVGKCPMAWQRVQVRNTLLATPLCPLSLAATQMALRTGGPTGGASMCWVHCTLLATSDGCPPLLMGTLRWMAPRMAPLVARGWCWNDLVQSETWLSTSGTTGGTPLWLAPKSILPPSSHTPAGVRAKCRPKLVFLWPWHRWRLGVACGNPMARKPCAKQLLLGSWLVHTMATVAGGGAVGATYLLAEAYQALTALRACGRPSSTVPKQRATGAGNCTPTLDLAHAEAWMALVALLASLIVFRRRGRRGGGGGGPSTRSISDTLWHHYHWRRAAQRWHHQCVAKSWHHCCAARATPPCLSRALPYNDYSVYSLS